MKRQRSKAFKCIFDILFATQYASLLNGAVSGRGKGWFLMDLSVKASLGNANHQMLQLPTANTLPHTGVTHARDHGSAYAEGTLTITVCLVQQHYTALTLQCQHE